MVEHNSHHKSSRNLQNIGKLTTTCYHHGIHSQMVCQRNLCKLSSHQLLNSRKFRSRLPMIVVQLEQHRSYRNTMQMDKEKQSVRYNKSAKNLPSIQQSQTVYVQLDPQKNYWTPGMIVGCPRGDRRSYRGRTTEGRTYIRNRKFIKPKDTNVQAQQQVQAGTPSARPIHNRRKPDRLVIR